MLGLDLSVWCSNDAHELWMVLGPYEINCVISLRRYDHLGEREEKKSETRLYMSNISQSIAEQRYNQAWLLYRYFFLKKKGITKKLKTRLIKVEINRIICISTTTVMLEVLNFFFLHFDRE